MADGDDGDNGLETHVPHGEAISRATHGDVGECNPSRTAGLRDGRLVPCAVEDGDRAREAHGSTFAAACHEAVAAHGVHVVSACGICDTGDGSDEVRRLRDCNGRANLRGGLLPADGEELDSGCATSCIAGGRAWFAIAAGGGCCSTCSLGNSNAGEHIREAKACKGEVGAVAGNVVWDWLWDCHIVSSRVLGEDAWARQVVRQCNGDGKPLVGEASSSSSLRQIKSVPAWVPALRATGEEPSNGAACNVSMLAMTTPDSRGSAGEEDRLHDGDAGD